MDMVDTSRLYKILAREKEELDKSERMESAFRNIKNTLSKKFSFKKSKTVTEEIAEVNEIKFTQKILHKLTDSIRNGFTKKKLGKPSVTNSMKDESEEDLHSVLDSAYFSLDQSYSQSEKEVLEEIETVHVSLLELFPLPPSSQTV